MCVLKGHSLMKIGRSMPEAVGLWSFMTQSEKLGWVNEVTAVVEFKAEDAMWMQSTITVYEWK